MNPRSLHTLSLLFAMTGGCARTLGDLPAAAPVQPGSADAGTLKALSAQSGPACFVTGQARTIAPRARISHGIAIAAVAEADGECKQAKMDNARTLSADPPFEIGVTGNQLSWSSCAQESPRALFTLPDGPIADLQGVARGADGFTVVFRQGNAIWMGNLDSNKLPQGPLSKVVERPELRSPTLAVSDGTALVLWAEHEPEQGRWSLGERALGEGVSQAAARVELPRGRVDGDAMQPALTGLSGGRFLLAWTEGTASAHEVRAVTLNEKGTPIGAALSVSPAVESGWAQPTVTPNGSGAVLFLTPQEDGFAVAATPIACPVVPQEEALHFALSRRED